MKYFQSILQHLILLSVFINAVTSEGCAKEDHQKCIVYADPLLKNPHLVFPDNMQDIDTVCITWSDFIDCIKRYIDRCFSKQKQNQFNAAVEAPISSVHLMCSVSSYQNEYLQHASCLKATVTEPHHCGNEYAALVNEVSKREVARASLCCYHYHFRSCIITKTKETCDSGKPSGAASKFSRQILDRALSFLQDQCSNYIPKNGDCLNSVTENSLALPVSTSNDNSDNRINNRRPYHRTLSPSDNYAGQASNFHKASTSGTNNFRSTGRSISVLPKSEEENREIHGIVAYDNEHETTLNIAEESTSKNVEEADVKSVEENKDQQSTASHSIEEPAIVVTQRSPSYGRGISWTTSQPKVTTEIPAWATSTWLNSNDESSTDTWYPAAGSFGGNNIDEPNQQGLKNNENGENGENGMSRSTFNLFFIIFSIFTIILV